MGSRDITAHVTWLACKGAFDAFLTVNPEKTFFKSIYSRHTNFSWTDVEILPDVAPVYGGEVRFKVPRLGDLATQMYLYYNITKLNYGVAQVNVARDSVAADGVTPTRAGVETTDTRVTAAFRASEYPLTADADYDGITHEKFQPAWIDHLGYVLTNTVELWIGGSMIESHTGDFLHTWDCLTRNTEESAIRGLPSEHGGQNNVGTAHDQHVYVPLRFFFNTRVGSALPIVALQYHDVEVVLKMNAKPLRHSYTNYFEKIPFRDPPSTDPDRWTKKSVTVFTGDTDTSVMDTGKPLDRCDVGGEIKALRLVTRYVLLDEFERKQFSQGTHTYLFTETKHLDFPLTKRDKLVKEFPLDTVSGTCKELIFFFRADHRRLEGSDEKNSNEEYWNFEGNRPFARNDMIDRGTYFVRSYGKQMTHIDNAFFDRATVMLNNSELYNPPRDPLWFNFFLPSEFHKRIPVENSFEMIYFVPFSLHPEDDQPTGSLNLSRVDRATLKFWFRAIPGLKDGAVMSNGRVHIYARVMNIFEVSNGHGRKLFLN